MRLRRGKRMKRIISIISIWGIINIAVNAYAVPDISKLFQRLQPCNTTEECRAIEREIVSNLLNKTDIKSVLEEIPDVKEIDYQIIACNLSGSKHDFIVKMVYDRIGYIAALIKEKSAYKLLPIINTGYIFSIKTIDLIGDEKDVIYVEGYGTGTGYQSKWVALYKYGKHKLYLIWSGLVEAEYTDENENIKYERYEIIFEKQASEISKRIIQKGQIKIVDSKTNRTLSERNIENSFDWSKSKFKYSRTEKGTLGHNSGDTILIK
jgi:hypothetical protein